MFAVTQVKKAIDDGNKVIVGVNRFVEAGEQPTMIFRPDPASEKSQIERLNKFRAGRDDAAVKTYASVGEISDAMRSVFGEYTPATAI